MEREQLILTRTVQAEPTQVAISPAIRRSNTARAGVTIWGHVSGVDAHAISGFKRVARVNRLIANSSAFL